MFSSIARSARWGSNKLLSKATLSKPQLASKLPAFASTNTTTSRYFSSTDPSVFKATPPEEITGDMADGIQDTTLFYLRNGISQQRLDMLAEDQESALVDKWQRMMEIYLSTQVFVISGLGYQGDEQGLQLYTHHLATFMADHCDDEEREMYRKVGNETWRELLATAFQLDLENIQSVTIADARDMMHKVSSKMQEPKILMKIQKECARLPEVPDNVELEMAQKHQVLQNIIVMDVYTGGSPSIVEECNFGSGEKGYAHMQCVMAEFESDPLIAQYAGAAMTRIWEAAGIDMASIQQAGNIRGGGGD